jgi:hypothetical protein
MILKSDFEKSCNHKMGSESNESKLEDKYQALEKYRKDF